MFRHPIAAGIAVIFLGAPPQGWAFDITVTDTGPGIYQAGATAVLEIEFDFSEEPTLGGGLDFMWDSAAFSSGFWTGSGVGLPKFDVDPIFGPGEALGAGISHFEGLSQGLFGTLSLVIASDAAPGQYSIVSSENLGGGTGYGQFYSIVTFAHYPVGSIEFGSATITVAPNVFDSDGDEVPDREDNCTEKGNADQRDTDADGIGNACDADLDNDCAITFGDLALLKQVFLSDDADADFNGDGSVNFGDLVLLRQQFLGQPGPAPSSSLCVIALETFGDGQFPDTGGWTTGFAGSLVLSDGDQGDDDRALLYIPGNGSGDPTGFHFQNRDPGSDFLGDYTAAGVANVEFRARHSGIGDDVVLRVVLFDGPTIGSDWAMTSATITVSAAMTSWQDYALSVRPTDLITGGLNGVPVADILTNVHQIGLRHDPTGSGPGNPSPVTNPTIVLFDDVKLTVGPIP